MTEWKARDFTPIGIRNVVSLYCPYLLTLPHPGKNIPNKISQLSSLLEEDNSEN